MTPWDLIVWALAVGISLVIVGFGAGIALLVINITRGKL